VRPATVADPTIGAGGPTTSAGFKNPGSGSGRASREATAGRGGLARGRVTRGRGSPRCACCHAVEQPREQKRRNANSRGVSYPAPDRTRRANSRRHCGQTFTSTGAAAFAAARFAASVAERTTPAHTWLHDRRAANDRGVS